MGPALQYQTLALNLPNDKHVGGDAVPLIKAG